MPFPRTLEELLASKPRANFFNNNINNDVQREVIKTWRDLLDRHCSAEGVIPPLNLNEIFYYFFLSNIDVNKNLVFPYTARLSLAHKDIITFPKYDAYHIENIALSFHEKSYDQQVELIKSIAPRNDGQPDDKFVHTWTRFFKEPHYNIGTAISCYLDYCSVDEKYKSHLSNKDNCIQALSFIVYLFNLK